MRAARGAMLSTTKTTTDETYEETHLYKRHHRQSSDEHPARRRQTGEHWLQRDDHRRPAPAVEVTADRCYKNEASILAGGGSHRAPGQNIKVRRTFFKERAPRLFLLPFYKLYRSFS